MGRLLQMSIRVSRRLLQLAAHVARLSTRHSQQCSDGLLTLRQPIHGGFTSNRVYSEKPGSHQVDGQGACPRRHGRSFASIRARQSPISFLPAQARHGGRSPQCHSKYMSKSHAGASSVLVIPERTGSAENDESWEVPYEPGVGNPVPVAPAPELPDRRRMAHAVRC